MEKPIKPVYSDYVTSRKPIEYITHSKMISFEKRSFLSKKDAFDSFMKDAQEFVNKLSEEIPDGAFNIKLDSTHHSYYGDEDSGFKIVWETKNPDYEEALAIYNKQVKSYKEALDKYSEMNRKYLKSLKATDEKYQNIAKENLQKYLAKNSGNIDMNVVNKLMEKIR